PAQSSSLPRVVARRPRAGRGRISAMRPSDTTTSASSTRRRESSVTTRAPLTTSGRAKRGRFGDEGATADEYRSGTGERQPTLNQCRMRNAECRMNAYPAFVTLHSALWLLRNDPGRRLGAVGLVGQIEEGVQLVHQIFVVVHAGENALGRSGIDEEIAVGVIESREHDGPVVVIGLLDVDGVGLGGDEPDAVV